MKWRPYADYTRTDIPGLEQIPAHWEVLKLKLIADVRGGVAKGKDLTGQETVRVPYLRVANVQDGYLDLAQVEEIDIPVRELDRYLLQPGDVLMNEGGDFDKLGRGHVWKGEVSPCIHQNHVFSVRPHRVRSEWLSTVSGSAYAQFFFMGRAKQSTNLASISATNLAELPVVMPPPEEQDQILAFLYRETSKIDALIAEQHTLVDRLQAMRIGIIAEYVTKGFDPTVPMKECGIRWIDHIPSHWQVTPLKWLTDQTRPIMYGIVLPGPDVGEGIPILKGGNVKPAKMNLSSMARTTPEIEAPFARARLKTGDLVYAIRGSIGECEIVPSELEGANITQDVARVAAAEGVYPPWLRWALLASFIRENLASGSNGAAIKGINIFDLKLASIPTPPPDEQRAIATFLTKETEVFDRLKAEAESAIALLQEHRAALITAVVTGKVDVHEVACV
jgi:type I restriction enzyme S subunit